MQPDDAGSPAPGEHLLADLTPEQRAAVTHKDGPLIVVAGPGSGKTRVITRRVAWLVAHGVPPWQILAITFTNKAADEMRRRVEDLVGAGGGVHVSTFHSFCARMLRQYEPPGRTPNYTIYDEDDARACVKRIVRELQLEEARWKAGDVLARISDAKSRLLSPEAFEAQAFDFQDRTISRIYAKYEETLAANNALDFDDLLLSLVRLLETREEVRDALRARFRYVLVDEYQDTNRPQYLLAKLLAGEGGNICVVGDPDQSIYKWRGADIRNILEFEKDHPGAREVRLERNYRSTKRILAAAQALIENNVERREKTLFTANEEGDAIRLVRRLNDDEEARFVADAVAASIEAGTPPAEIAVFYRTNALSRKFEEALRARAIPHTVVGAVPFFQRKEVKDALAHLRLLANPADEQQLRRATAVAEGLGPTTLKRLEAFAVERGLTLLEAARRAGEAPEVKARERRAVADFVQVIDGLAALEPAPVGPMLKHIAEETKLRARLLQSKSPQDWARAENLDALVNEGYEFDTRGGGDFRAFLDHVALLSSTDQEKDERSTVKLMTLHAAKGLEFDEVFIVGADAGILPLEREMEACDLEEERRLFYVGLTRARKRATLTTVGLRRTYGQERPCRPSSFVGELPAELLAKQGGTRVYEDDDDGERAPASRLAYAPLRPARRDAPAARPPPALPKPLPSYAASAGGRGRDDVAPGDRVQHAIFGAGAVLDLSGSGLGRRVRVQFDAVGLKTLILHYANLEKI
jgi:DNA helicase-2/ATP-dependent DNA helicase PcrA